MTEDVVSSRQSADVQKRSMATAKPVTNRFKISDDFIAKLQLPTFFFSMRPL
jgi:hypothetical protein